ncbi:uncharacterized protein [Patagioenas fasciata]|uniref:uncharacterized protein n=1 Tax=Patagioenas fasciata TaxID=372321 RepID=UPI003A9A502C
MQRPSTKSGAESAPLVLQWPWLEPQQLWAPAPRSDGRVTVGSAGRVTVMSLWGCDTGALVIIKGAAPGGAGASGAEPPWCWAGAWRVLSRNPRRVPELRSNGAGPSTPGCRAPWPWVSSQCPGTGWRGLCPPWLLQWVPLALQRRQWAELGEAVRELVEVKKLLKKKLQNLQERRQRVQEPAALPEPRGVRSRGKVAQGSDAEPALLQELVAVRLEEQLASRWHRSTCGLRRLLLFLALLQIIILTLVLLEGDVLNNSVLPPKLAAASGSCPARPRCF